MNKLTGILLFSLFPGIVMVIINIIWSLTQNTPITFNSILIYFVIGFTIGSVLVILRLLIKGELWK
ncbi:hypothetical protein HUG15_21710 [Salicibibacter cibarius]|uniref:Uncharacterized protein n=1 Tax=Salicibibacter cibarius TaxID=2743000 RepID=A0A7T6Z766_9BACI|nr:hypothetical protein [Salicibibacter cibarius]QQK77937.1 hypothetical protein HUG15_21710 [Salicibibacter cibarius]